MRPLRILTLTTVVALVVAGAASASVRDGTLASARTAEDAIAALTDTAPPAAPSGEPSATPTSEPTAAPSGEPTVEPPGEPGEAAGHGAAVSAVARDKDAVATWVNPAGKEITNHGKAVSAVARSGAGKGDAAEGDGTASVKGKKDK